MDVMFDYTIRGRICVPEGSKLNDTETGIILPDGRQLKLWEQVEVQEDGEVYHDYDLNELEALGIFYDGDCSKFDGPVDEGDRVWPPLAETEVRHEAA